MTLGAQTLYESLEQIGLVMTGSENKAPGFLQDLSLKSNVWILKHVKDMDLIDVKGGLKEAFSLA